MDKPVLEFKIETKQLTANEKQVLETLVDAARLIEPLYNAQENNLYTGAGFYDSTLSKDEIKAAAEKDPEILSPYTVVEKRNGKIVAVPYHIKYAEFLKPIVEKLLKAAKITDNEAFSRCLIKQAEALTDGSYNESTIEWMKMEPYVLDINIGPVERYNDRLFFVKTSYQAWVGVMDKNATDTLVRYEKIIFTARREALMPSEKVDYYDKVHLRVDNLLILSGLIARTKFVGVNLPNDPLLMEQYGSEITMFNQTNEIRYQTNKSIFHQIFDEEFAKQFSDEDLRIGSLGSTALHELSHTYLRYRDSEERLQDLFPVIDELAATVMGIKVCGTLLLKDVVTQKQLESIMLAYTCRSFGNVLKEKDNKTKLHYIIGGAIFLNYLFEYGALQYSKGVSWPNFTKMFFSISELASRLERILSLGTREDAEHFISQYGSIESLQKFK